MCNIEIDGLVYGEGNKITKLKALEEYDIKVDIQEMIDKLEEMKLIYERGDIG